jgi:BirA family transcriptional regulator, biotin operon repressor / biotin---[acetyl-CoA-carboxylase] ligase
VSGTLHARLERRGIAWPAAIERFESVASTSDVLSERARSGASGWHVVLAERQTAGRGRLGRPWVSSAGDLFLSLLLRPADLGSDLLAALPLLAGVAVSRAADEWSVPTRLKWPNDVLVEGRKIAGILLESRRGAMAPAVVALGIGVNLRQRGFPAELAERATSVRLANGREVERDTLLSALLARLDHWRDRLESEGFAPVRERWRALADTLGRAVSVDGVDGVAVDLDEDGALLVEDAHGVRRRVVAGDVVEART